MKNRILNARRALGLIAVTAVAGTLAACSTTGMPAGRGATAEGGAEAPVAAQVALFDELFRSNGSALQQGAGSYCISTGPDFETGTVNPQVLAAFRANPRVKPASACEVREGGNGVFDRQTRSRSLLFNVGRAACTSDRDCLLYGGYYEGNLSSQTNRYRLRLVDGTWQVSMEEMGPAA